MTHPPRPPTRGKSRGHEENLHVRVGASDTQRTRLVLALMFACLSAPLAVVAASPISSARRLAAPLARLPVARASGSPLQDVRPPAVHGNACLSVGGRTSCVKAGPRTSDVRKRQVRALDCFIARAHRHAHSVHSAFPATRDTSTEVLQGGQTCCVHALAPLRRFCRSLRRRGAMHRDGSRLKQFGELGARLVPSSSSWLDISSTCRRAGRMRKQHHIAVRAHESASSTLDTRHSRGRRPRPCKPERQQIDTAYPTRLWPRR
ncbi:hypothetical protein OH77DRAFT_913015 [Trametes cingulata]|nr:hypothetical protein OH77DRAFT_846555 [Trametes cingulata]KAI0360234.1 hypothetical protein OH77DRAFT_913015 [Trametes cingulata]